MRSPRLAISLAGVALVGVVASLTGHHTGVVARAIVVGQNPGLIAVDNRTGRAFVLDDGTQARNGGGGIVEGAIHMLDTRTGALVGTVPAGTGPNGVAADEQTGRVFVLNSYMHNGGQGTVTVLDAHSGRIMRTTLVGDLPMALALDPYAGRVLVLNVPNGVHVLHAHYAQVSVLDAASGRLIGGVNPAPGAGPGFGSNQLVLDVERHRFWLAVPGLQGRTDIKVFDTRTNALVRRIPLPATNATAIALSAAAGRAFVFMDKQVLVLDTSRMRAVRVIRSPIYGESLVDERTGRLFVAEQDWSAAPNAPNWGRTETGHLHILDLRTGAVLQTLPIEWPDGLAVDERTGWLLISHAGAELSDGLFAGAGHVDVRDGLTGRLLRTIPVGVVPGAMVVDGPTHQALVVNRGGQVPARDPWGWLPTWARQHVPLLPPPPAPTRSVPSSVSLIALGP